jgi:GMP synthase-like glutamine amidotransferase
MMLSCSPVLVRNNTICSLTAEHTAQDTSNPFVTPLIDYVRNVATNPDFEHIKLVGVCFGHQIISIAMGGSCVPGEQGWEIGVYANQLTDDGRYWWCGDVSGQGGEAKVVSSAGPSFSA